MMVFYTSVVPRMQQQGMCPFILQVPTLYSSKQNTVICDALSCSTFHSFPYFGNHTQLNSRVNCSDSTVPYMKGNIKNLYLKINLLC